MPRPFTEPERARVHRALRDAGRAALAEGGLRRAPVERLAAAAGISKGAFYLFFPSKEALLVALLREAETELRAGILARVDAAPPAERVGAVLRYLFDAVATHPLLRSLGDPEEWGWLLRSLPDGHLEAARADDDAFFLGLLRRLQADGVAGPVDPEAFAALGAAALAVAHHRALVGDARRYDALVDLLVRGLTAALAPPPGRSV